MPLAKHALRVDTWRSQIISTDSFVFQSRQETSKFKQKSTLMPDTK